MSNNPLSNLGWEDIIEFLQYCTCERGRVQGDDLVMYYPKNRTFGILVNVNPKLKRSGYPMGTLLNNIRTLRQMSGNIITKKTWCDWFRKKRNF